MTEPKVLIIDSDAEHVAGLSRALRRLNYKVTWAKDAESGWEKLMAERPDVILLDAMLPSGTEGFHLVWKLRGHDDPAVSQTPVAIVSAIHHHVDIKLYPELADDHYRPGEFLPVQKFLDKPVKTEQLLATVTELLRPLADSSRLRRSE